MSSVNVSLLEVVLRNSVHSYLTTGRRCANDSVLGDGNLADAYSQLHGLRGHIQALEAVWLTLTYLAGIESRGLLLDAVTAAESELRYLGGRYQTDQAARGVNRAYSWAGNEYC